MRVFVTGGTGLVGKRLIRQLRKRGIGVVALSRRKAAAEQLFGVDATVVEGDPMKTGPWMDAVADCDAVIHLAGENVFAKRWNDEFKTMLRESRTLGTANVVQALARNPKTASGSPKVLVSASAIGYYGPHGDEELTEDSPPAADFMARLCVDWENAAKAAEAHGVRVALVRIGVVLDKEGGALGKLLTPFKLGAGGPIGNGKQYMSWIHHEDLVGIFLHALERPETSGPYNGTGPHPVTNKDFGKALGKVLGRPSFMPTPAFALKMLLGEAADIVTQGQRVLPKRTLAAGYVYQFPEIEKALADVVK